MKLYPIFANIENRLAVVIGGGEVAGRKIKDLLEAGANVKVISPKIHEEIKELTGVGLLEIKLREYKYGDISGACLVFAATNNAEVNKMVFAEAEEKGILINSVDDPPNCSFYVPSMIRRDDFILAVSTSGSSPAMAAKLRRMFEKTIPENIEEILNSLRDARSILYEFESLKSSDRGMILKRIVNDDLLLQECVIENKNGNIKNFLKKLI